MFICVKKNCLKNLIENHHGKTWIIHWKIGQFFIKLSALDKVFVELSDFSENFKVFSLSIFGRFFYIG